MGFDRKIAKYPSIRDKIAKIEANVWKQRTGSI